MGGPGGAFDTAHDSPRLSLHHAGRFTLHNVCVAFHNTSSAAYRAQFISRRGERALIHGFSEFSWRFTRLASVRPASKEEARSLLPTCERRALGLALYFQSNNIFHAVHHTPQAWASLRAHAEQARAVGEEAAFVPLVGYVAGAAERAWARPPEWRAHAWEFMLRGLSERSSEEIGAELGRLLHARCTCFGRVEGEVGAFSPYANQPEARALLRGWRTAVLANARVVVGRLPPMPPSGRAGAGAGEATGGSRAGPDMLYVSRAGLGGTTARQVPHHPLPSGTLPLSGAARHLRPNGRC